MNNEIQYVVTVRFAPWEDEFDGEVTNHPSFGVKYLVTMPFIEYPFDEDDESEEALIWDPEDEVKKQFLSQYENTIHRKFDGEILLIENVNLVSLRAPAEK